MTNSRKKVIREFQREIESVYAGHSLTSLRGLNNDFIVNGRQIYRWYYETVLKGHSILSKDFNVHQAIADLIFCSDEIKNF
jgi:hypothetical protein